MILPAGVGVCSSSSVRVIGRRAIMGWGNALEQEKNRGGVQVGDSTCLRARLASGGTGTALLRAGHA